MKHYEAIESLAKPGNWMVCTVYEDGNPLPLSTAYYTKEKAEELAREKNQAIGYNPPAWTEEEFRSSVQDAEVRGVRAGFFAALKYMEDGELAMAIEEAFSDRPEHFHRHLMQKLERDSRGDRRDFYVQRLDEECQNKLLSHYLEDQ